MRLFEYQAKELFRAYGLPVPKSILASDVDAIRGAFASLTPPVAIKSQVLAGGRGKAGGIAIVSDATQAEREASRIFNLSIGGERPSTLLVEEAYPHDSEMYLSVSLDRGDRSFVAIAAMAGGVDVESLAGKVIRKVPLGGIDEGFAAEVSDEVIPVRGADGRVDVIGTMQAITNVIEGWVREHPEQWLWVHRRWR